MKNEEVVALMEAMETRLLSSMEERFKEHRSATSDQISRLVEAQSLKRKRTTSSLSVISSDMNKHLEFENLPREIVVEIMSRLPTESLMRFRCLNKSWYFLIRCLVNDPGFVAQHQTRAEAHPTFLHFNEPPLCRDRHRIPPNSNSRGEDQTAVRPQRIFSQLITTFVETAGEKGEIRCVTKDIDVSHLPSSLVRRRLSDYIEINHCNGIVFLTKDRRALTLYNPVMNVFSTFEPKSDVKVNREIKIIAMGFGSDSGASSFKFVRILSSMKAQVYNPGNSNNSWREIEFLVCKNKLGYIVKHVYVRGYIFWLFEYPWLCLCFDVAGESFQIVDLPDDITAKKFTKLATREGSLCLFAYSYDEHVDMWVMNIGDGSFSWRKLIRIECLPGRSGPSITFWRSDKLLICTGCYDVMSYDIYTKEYKKVSANGVLGKIYYLGPYVNSLASVKWMIKNVR